MFRKKQVSKSISKIPSPPPFSHPYSPERGERQKKEDNPGEETEGHATHFVRGFGGEQHSVRYEDRTDVFLRSHGKDGLERIPSLRPPHNNAAYSAHTLCVSCY